MPGVSSVASKAAALYADAQRAADLADLVDLNLAVVALAKGGERAVVTHSAPTADAALESATRRFRRKMAEAARSYRDSYLSEIKWEAIDELLGTEGSHDAFRLLQHPSELTSTGLDLLIEQAVGAATGSVAASALVELWRDGYFGSFHDGAQWSLGLLSNQAALDFNLRDPNIIQAINSRIDERVRLFGRELGDAVSDWLRNGLFEQGKSPLDMRRSLKHDWPGIAGWRFDRIARTESLIGVNSGSFETMRRNGVQFIEWQAHLDNRVRPSHREMDGYEVKVGDKFPNGCRYPGDPDASIKEIVNCRCVLAPVNPDLMAPDRLWTGGELPSAMAGPGDMYDNLFDYSIVNDGATFNPRLGRYYSGSGYGVAARQGTFRTVSVNDRAAFKQAVADLRHQYPDAYVGTWVHDGMIDIDPSLVVRDRADAVKQAIERNQQSIWDFTKCEEIPTGGTGR